PCVFIPIAEESGMIIPLGEWIFTEACQAFVEWQKEGLAIDTIAINLSSIQFRQENLVSTLQSIITKVGIDARCVEIEITERYIMESTEQNMTLLEELRNIGFKISIDDFGTGYSSMSYLKMLPLDTLKIDKSFIDDIPYDLNDVAITQAILALAKSLNFHVVAEGIENKEQEDFLLANGCDTAQGYLFAKPMSATSFKAFLHQN
ncbi:MAG: EAL domain-containing protein, partial [Campylobacteraceae bacterium]|nr:EAL domain-containing protein [Campylobacteraceae bacterium]